MHVTFHCLSIPRDPYSFFLQVVSRASMQDDILALAKFNLPVQKLRMATVQQVNGKFTFLLFSRVRNCIEIYNSRVFID